METEGFRAFPGEGMSLYVPLSKRTQVRKSGSGDGRSAYASNAIVPQG